MKKRTVNPVHIKYRADFEAGRVSVQYTYRQYVAKRDSTPNNNPLLVKFVLLCS